MIAEILNGDILGEMKDPVTRILDEIERCLKRDGRSIADLANDLGLSYHQVYGWVRTRRFNPRAAALMKLQKWLAINEKPKTTSVAA